MAYYRCGPTAIGSRMTWGPVSTPGPGDFERPLNGNYDRIFNAFERTTAFEYVRNTFEGKDEEKKEERHVGHQDVVVNRKMSSSFERADCALAAQTPCDDDEDFYREKILYSQARQLYPLQEDLADWINKTIGISYLTGENFLDVLDNGAELCQLAAVIHDRARDALDQGLIVGPVPQIKGRCWQRAARRSFFSRDNAENFLTFCRELGVHENLLFESDDLVLHNQPRQVILCLLEVARLAARYGLEPPGLVQLEKEIALEEKDSGIDATHTSWQFRDISPLPDKSKDVQLPSTSNQNETQLAVPDNVDAESTKSEETVASTDSDVPLKPTNELDKRVQLVTRLMERGCSCSSGKCSKLLKVKKVGEGRYNIAGRNVFIRLLKGRHMMVRVGGGWDTLEHFLSRHEPCQVRLVTPGRRAHTLTPLPEPLQQPDHVLSPASSKTSLRGSGTVSPVESKASSLSGKSSPLDKPARRPDPSREIKRTSTPVKPTRDLKSTLTLPLKDSKIVGRPRKQSAPNFSTPSTPVSSARTPPMENKKTLAIDAAKKTRSASLTSQRVLCGAEKLDRPKKKSVSAATTPTEPRKQRSLSSASTPVNEPRKSFEGYAKKTRSMSVASTPEPLMTMRKSASLAGPVLTPAAIERSIRLSLEASIADDHSPKRPFLHIKAKYRSPPPREVPPR